MKKAFCFLCIFSLFAISIISVYADVLKYEPNVFTDTTTIEEDFKNLSMDINDYYKPKYIYEKWYVIGMSERYVNTDTFDIQTYFYIYNPISPHAYEYYDTEEEDGEEYYNKIESFGIRYALNDQELSMDADVLSINYEHHLYKIKAFSYSFTTLANISIFEIHNNTTGGNRSKTSESSFKATCNHSKLNGFAVELNFSTTLILEEYEAVIVYISEEKPYYSTWNSFWEHFFSAWKNEYKLVFYNFNFPKRIKPDSIEYAKFQYTKEVEYKKYHKSLIYEPSLRDNKLESSRDIHEYTPGTFKIQVNSASKELDFPTFYLGDRIKDNQFGYLEFEEDDKKKFNYQASILLDCLTDGLRTTTGIQGDNLTGWHLSDNDYIERYESVKDIEFLELHYKKDGILYKCQIVSQPVNPTPVRPIVEKSLWDKFLEWFIENFPLSALIVIVVPIIAIVVAIFCPQVAILALKGLIGLIVSVIKVIISLVTFPFRLIISLFKKRE